VGIGLTGAVRGIVEQENVERSSMELEKLFEKFGGDALHIKLFGRDIIIVRHPKYFSQVQKDTVRQLRSHPFLIVLCRFFTLVFPSFPRAFPGHICGKAVWR
jgi:hypothetical protein